MIESEIKPINICIPIDLFDTKLQVYEFLDLILSIFDKQKKSGRDKDDELTFHYFFEGGIIEVRMKIYDALEREIIRFINEYFKGKEEFVSRNPIQFKEYVSENRPDQFGDQWYIVEKYLEYTARASIHIIRNNPSNLFRETKLLHCFMNQLGYDTLRETAFYNFASGNMMLKYFRELDTLGIKVE